MSSGLFSVAYILNVLKLKITQIDTKNKDCVSSKRKERNNYEIELAICFGLWFHCIYIFRVHFNSHFKDIFFQVLYSISNSNPVLLTATLGSFCWRLHLMSSCKKDVVHSSLESCHGHQYAAPRQLADATHNVR